MIYAHDEGKNEIQLCDGEKNILKRQLGGTGIEAETEEELLLALGGTKFTKLWENASPTSNFAAQTLSLDLKDYDEIEVVFKQHLSADNDFSQKLKVGNQTALLAVTNVTTPSASVYIAQRLCETSETGVTFESGGFKYTDKTTYNSNNGYALPIRIYGIKGVR